MVETSKLVPCLNRLRSVRAQTHDGSIVATSSLPRLYYPTERLDR